MMGYYVFENENGGEVLVVYTGCFLFLKQPLELKVEVGGRLGH